MEPAELLRDCSRYLGAPNLLCGRCIGLGGLLRSGPVADV